MKYTADCPQCETEFEIGGPLSAAAGLRCPSCGNDFTPEKIHRQEAGLQDAQHLNVTPQGDGKGQASSSSVAVNNSEYERLHSLAGILKMSALVSFALSVLAVIIGVAQGMGGDEPGAVWYYVSGGLWSMGIVLIILSQLVHIRAGMEKLSRK